MSDYTLVQPEVQQPEVFPIDATKCQSLEEVGMLLNALGLAMTKEYAEQNGLTHLLKTEE
jgi:hypothetical protein